MEKIEKVQIKTIWSIWRGGLGYSEDDFYQMLGDRYGYVRMHDLSKKEAQALIIELRTRSETTPSGASLKQMSMIYAYKKKWNWSSSALRGFVRKIAGVSDPGWLDGRQAWKVCAAMKDMDAQNMASTEGKR